MNPVPTVSYAPFLDLAVCHDTQCQHAVKVGNLARHLRQVHKVSSEKAAEMQSEVQSRQISLPEPVPSDRQMYLDTITQRIAASSKTSSSHPMPLPPLPFLPVVQCKQCLKCGEIKQSDDSMRRHLRECYSPPVRLPSVGPAVDGSLDSDSNTKQVPASMCKSAMVTIFAQSIFGGKNTAWFPVIDEQSTTLLQLLQLEQGSAPGSGDDTSAPHLDSFLSEMRYDVQLKMYKISMQDAYNAAQWGSRPPYPHARRVLAAYLHQAFSVAAQKPYIKSHVFLDTPLRLALSTETMRTYITRLSRLLTFLFTVSSEWPQSKRITFMTNAQHSQVNEFKHICTAADSNLTPALSKFHIIARSILFDPLDTNQTVIPLFISCTAVKRSNYASVSQTFRFGNAQETSPMLAAMKYLAKCAAVTHIYAFPRSATERLDAWKLLSAATSEYADCGATVIASNLRCCHRLADTESHHIHTVLCTRHSMCGIVDGVELSLAQLGGKIHTLQHTSWELLETKLMMGLRLNGNFWQTLSTLQDALGEKSPGYWYLMHPHNYDSLNAWRRAYVNAVHPHLFNSDASVKEDAAEQFIKNSMELHDHLYTLMQLCSGGPARATESAALRIRNTPKATRNIFVSQGQLLTILTYSKTRNTQDGTGRAIVRCPDAVTAGMMHIYMLLINPMQTLLAAKVQNESPPPVVPSVMPPPPPPPLRWSIAAGELRKSDDSAVVNPLDFMFDTSSPDRLRAAFTSCLTSVDVPLNTTQYRHYHSAVVKNFLPAAAAAWKTDFQDDPSNSHTLHIQAGHTEHTATKTYGVARSQLTSLTSTELHQFRNASETWHRVLRLPTGSPIPFTEKKHPYSFGSQVPSEVHHQQVKQCNNTETPMNGRSHPSAPPPPTNASQPTQYSATGATGSSDMIATAQIMARLDCIENSLNLLLASAERQSSVTISRAAGNPDMNSKLCFQTDGQIPGTSPSSATDIKSKPSLSMPPNTPDGASLSLQTFLQSPNANFRSQQQKEAVLHALQPGNDVLVVQPTGSGKSLLFMLPAFMKPEKISFVVVPLVSLQQDLIHRCAAKGITAVRFADYQDTAGARIVIVSAEHLVLPAYAALLRTAAAKQTLHAIFIDEAHLVLLWKNFRQSLQDVREFVRPHDIAVPIIAMTATCPPTLQDRLSVACGMQAWQVMRSPTTRRNIRYSVRQVAASSMMLAAAQLIDRIANNCDVSTGDMRLILYIQNKARCTAVKHVFSLICPQIRCLVYHADLSDTQRASALQEWQANISTKPRLMIATSAFGCGIDVPSVRCVLHLGIPSTVIDFLQESGRAGRDGLKAESIILHQPILSIPTTAAVQTTQADQNYTERSAGRGENIGSVAVPSAGFGAPSALCTTPKTDCRRWFIDTFADGATDKRSCQSRNLEPCDHCEALLGDGNNQTKRRREIDVDVQHTEENRNVTVRGCAGPSAAAAAAPTSALPGGCGTRLHNSTRRRTAPINSTTVTNSDVPEATGIISGNYSLPPVPAIEDSQVQPATADDLRHIAERLYGTCPPCSTATANLVRHKTQTVHCFNNICLRCCGSGHKASLCPNLTLPPNTLGCYRCSLNKVNGKVVHNAGTYGKRGCQLKIVFCYCICMWETARLRKMIEQRIQCTSQFSSTAEFVQWLRNGTDTKPGPGILLMVPVIQALLPE